MLLEIIAGSLAAIEKEVETAIARTSRSPMIRDAHDFRAGIHDRLLRKLTGRSYSALVHPIARDFPLATMRPGDVFFHNDVYLSEGGIGHLPDLCVTVPVFARRGGGRRARGGGVRAGVRAPRRHRRGRAGLDAEPRHERVLRGPDGAADPAVGRRRAEPGGAHDHDPQLADARVAGRRPGRGVLGLPARRAPAGRAVRPLRPGRRRGVLRRDRGQHHPHVPAGDPGEDPGRDLDVGGLRRARRRGRAATAHAADHAHPDRRAAAAADPRLHRDRPAGQGPDQPLRELRRRQLPRQVARADPAQPRRDRRSGRPSSTSTRASST